MAGYQISAAPFGGEDAILGVMDLTQSGLPSLVYSTYFGGSRNDAVSSLALDPSGNAVISGYTISLDLPVTPDAVQPTYGGDTDAWVAVINPNLPFQQGLVYSTYLGGSGGDAGTWASADAAGNLWVAGYTLSPDFPLANAVQGSWPGGIDLFVTGIKRGVAGHAGLIMSSYVGGATTYTATSVAMDTGGNLFVTGYGGVGLPTSPASAQGGFAGGINDGFVLVIGTSAGTQPAVTAVPARNRRPSGEHLPHPR